MIAISIILLLIHTLSMQLTFPVSFTIVRNLNQPLTLSSFFKRTGCCLTDPETKVTSSYNLISLDGFSSTSTSSSILSDASPLGTWANAFSAITSSKDSIAGNFTPEVQRHILNRYHANSSLLIFNALANEAPISSSNISASSLADRIIATLTATQLDGVSI